MDWIGAVEGEELIILEFSIEPRSVCTGPCLSLSLSLVLWFMVSEGDAIHSLPNTVAGSACLENCIVAKCDLRCLSRVE